MKTDSGSYVRGRALPWLDSREFAANEAPLLLLLAALAGLTACVGVVPPALAQQPDGQRREVLFTGSVSIPPGKQVVKQFATQTNYSFARIAGSLQATGGAGNDIRILISRNTSLVYDSGRKRSVVMSVDFTEAGQYVLVIDNSFSVVSPKVVSGTISLVYGDADDQKNAALQQETLKEISQGQRILQRVYDALKEGEKILGTAQLSSVPSLRLINNSAINAAGNWAGNYIAVNRGTFQFADALGEGDDVLAFLLGHELSHIFYHHPGYGSASQGVKGLFDELRGVTALDRVQEQEADVLGLQVACAAGFDPNGALVLMDRFIEQDPVANSFMKNHPSAIERRDYLRGEVGRCQALRPQIEAASPVKKSSKWHMSENSSVEWTFEIGDGHLFGTHILATSRVQLGDYDVVDLKKDGDTYTGVQRERFTYIVPNGGSARACEWEFAVEVTATDNRIQGRWEGYPADSKLILATCQRTGERIWQSVAWVPE